MNRNSLQWLLRGFLFGLLILALAGSFGAPVSINAQVPTDPNQDALKTGEQPAQVLSDDPLGRPPQIPPEGQLVRNEESFQGGAGEVSLKTDDPRGVSGEVVLPQGEPPLNKDAVGEDNSTGLLSGAEEQMLAVQPLSFGAFTSPLVIPAADFRSDGIDPDGYRFWFSTGYLQGTAGATGVCLMAPAYLPNNANVYEFWFSGKDNDASYNLNASLWRVDNYSGVTVNMASIGTTGNSTALQSLGTSTITSPVVSFPGYSYYVTMCAQSENIQLYSMRIWYTMP